MNVYFYDKNAQFGNQMALNRFENKGVFGDLRNNGLKRHNKVF